MQLGRRKLVNDSYKVQRSSRGNAPWIIALSALLIFLCTIIFILAIGKKLTLIAQEDIYIVKELKNIPSLTNLIGILKKGERAEILDCIDVKSYIVAKIRLLNDEEGYVAQGHFSLEEMPAYSFQQQTIVFSLCPW
jgi:hypothetical protein